MPNAPFIDDADAIFAPVIRVAIAPPPHVDLDEIAPVGPPAPPRLFDADDTCFTPLLLDSVATVNQQPKKPGRKATPEALVQDCRAMLEAHWGGLPRTPPPKQNTGTESGTKIVDDYLKKTGRRMGGTTIERRVVRPIWRKLFG
jgi:hypothetical protein